MDLDQSGHAWQKVRTNLGPSLGWVDQQVQPSVSITSGSYVVQPGDSLLLVNSVVPVTIQLPDVRAWMQQTAYQPGTAFDRSITVKDIGGNAANFNITVAAFGSQTIDASLTSTVINIARAAVKFVPLNDFSGWFEEIATPGGGGGGGGDVFKAGNNTFTGTNTFNATITVPTVATGDNSTNAASTAWVKLQGYLLPASLAGYAPLASPAFTGTPTAPTVGTGDNSTTLATTAFVKAVLPAPGAPTTSQYGLAASDSNLPNGRVFTNTASVTWDFSTAGQIKANTAAGGGNVSNVGTPTSGQLATWTTATTIQGVTTLPAANEPAHTGDVTNTAGSLVLTIANAAVTYAKMQNVSVTARILGRMSVGSGSPEEMTLSQTLDLIGGATQGDILYRGATTWARLAAGTSGQFLQTQGAAANPLWAVPAGGGTHSINVQKFTASGTYTPTAGINCAVIECVGGGGAGGGAVGTSGSNYGGGGGGGGGYSRRLVTAAQIGASQTVTIGAGGSGVIGANGNGGGATSVGSLCIAAAGAPGVVGSAASFGAGGISGIATAVGDITVAGNVGEYGEYFPTPSGGLSFFVGKGGSSMWGPGAPPATGSGSGVTPASGNGGGGSGALTINTTASAAGGNGTNGMVIITEYIGT